jgi:cysteine sulfinate desulfinase/cysteine desulfurase-like protein
VSDLPGAPSALEKLCHGVRAIAPTTEIHLKPSETQPGHWAVMVVAGAAIVIYTDFAPIEISLEAACKKLSSISARMMAAVHPSSPPPPPSSDKNKK